MPKVGETKMPTYKIKVSARDPRFHNRKNIMLFASELDIIPVDDTEVICNSCNANIYDPDVETFGWLIYFDKRDVKADRPYDVYCEACTDKRFPKAIEVLPAGSPLGQP